MGLVLERGRQEGYGGGKGARVGCVLQGVQNGGAGARGEGELAGSAGREVVRYDAVDLGAEGLRDD